MVIVGGESIHADSVSSELLEQLRVDLALFSVKEGIPKVLRLLVVRPSKILNP
jgi:hypothetical protein